MITDWIHIIDIKLIDVVHEHTKRNELKEEKKTKRIDSRLKNKFRQIFDFTKLAVCVHFVFVLFTVAVKPNS